MWILKKLTDETVKYLFSGKKSFTVGRKNCDIILENDTSISRKHCTIYVAKKNECPFSVSTSTGVWVVDEQSKYGTFVNSNGEWVKLNSNDHRKLVDGNVIKFGLMESIFRFEYKPIVVCTSGISNQKKQEVQNLLKQIDGEFSNAWSKDCSVVIVNEVTLTVKVVLALINGVPIVTPQYLEKLVDCVKNETPHPQYENFRPEIKESVLDASSVSLDIKQNRKELFKGKKFVIPSKKQLDILKEVIISAGGKVELFASNGNWHNYGKDDTVVIQIPINNSVLPEELMKSFKSLTVFLKNKYERRIIPESEIAQAVAYSSTEKYCNPASGGFILRRENVSMERGNTLVEETPVMSQSSIREPYVVPSSLTLDTLDENLSCAEESQKSLIGKKRNHSPEKLISDNFKKKPRDTTFSSDANNTAPNISTYPSNESSQNKSATVEDKKTTKTDGVQGQKTSITNYFSKLKKPVASPECIKERNSFWTNDKESSSNLKRKLPAVINIDDDDDDGGESSGEKKAKYSSTKVSEVITPKAAEIVPEAVNVRELSNQRSSTSFHGVRKIVDNEKDEDFNNYIEKNKTDFVSSDTIEELNNTIYSLSIISAAFLKENGSLIDPPPVPRNVKKFKKQKIISGSSVQPTERIEDDLSGDDWLEPHPPGHQVLVSGRDDW